MITITRIFPRALFTALCTVAAAGCDEVPEGMEGLADEALVDEEAGAPEGVRGEDGEALAPAVGGLADVPGEASAVTTYFKLQSKQTRTLQNNTVEKLCFEPLDNREGSPVLQTACNNSSPGQNNPQAFFKHETSHRIQYALKDWKTGNDLCLHLTGGTPSISDGVAVVLYQCHTGRPNQMLWASKPDADGAIALMADHSHRCLTVFGALDSDLALLYQFSLFKTYITIPATPTTQEIPASCVAKYQRWYLKTDGGTFGWGLEAPEGWFTPAYSQG